MRVRSLILFLKQKSSILQIPDSGQWRSGEDRSLLWDSCTSHLIFLYFFPLSLSFPVFQSCFVWTLLAKGLIFPSTSSLPLSGITLGSTHFRMASGEGKINATWSSERASISKSSLLSLRPDTRLVNVTKALLQLQLPLHFLPRIHHLSGMNQKGI